MMPRVGRRRGGAPVATRRDRELERAATRDAASTASDEPVATNGRATDATTTPGTLEDRR